MRDANLAKRGIDPSDDNAQLEAIEEHGNKLLEIYKQELEKKTKLEGDSTNAHRDASLLDPLQKSIQMCLENEKLAVPDLEHQEEIQRLKESVKENVVCKGVSTDTLENEQFYKNAGTTTAGGPHLEENPIDEALEKDDNIEKSESPETSKSNETLSKSESWTLLSEISKNEEEEKKSDENLWEALQILADDHTDQAISIDTEDVEEASQKLEIIELEPPAIDVKQSECSKPSAAGNNA